MPQAPFPTFFTPRLTFQPSTCSRRPLAILIFGAYLQVFTRERGLGRGTGRGQKLDFFCWQGYTDGNCSRPDDRAGEDPRVARRDCVAQ